MEDVMMGVVAPGDPNDAPMMKEAGIEWVRLGSTVPFAGGPGSAVSDRYKRHREQLQEWADRGMKILCVTPGPGSKLWEPDQNGKLQLVWHRRLPEWFGKLGGEQCLTAYEETCAWLGEDLIGVVQAWQIGNELDWHQFAGPMNLREACDFIIVGTRGLKAANAAYLCGHNPTGGTKSYFFYGRLFADGLMDYCGIDRYYGSWQPGGPEDWGPMLDELEELTQAPVIINEWGFSSAGGVMTDQDRRKGEITCSCHRWPHTWGPGHTPEGQAEFIRQAFDQFVEHRHQLMGQFYFRWADQATCWQCGKPDCPAETAWGLVDTNGNPKPSYHALKEGIARLRAADAD